MNRVRRNFRETLKHLPTGILILSFVIVFMASYSTSEGKEKSKMEHTGNRLQYEKSPYLLQHKDNPVDWYPWGKEAFEKAKRENKPIFLSIGYSTCHWCHVMERESFEDEEVAKLMNDTFVSIKVDREERPDIDQIYMTVSQMLTGSGGWPLTIIMTPDKKPFFAGTYFPKESRFGRIGMVELIPRVAEIWKIRHEDVVSQADKITEALTKATSQSSTGGTLDETTLKTAYSQLIQSYDAVNGGFGGAPKFPTPHNLLFLLRYWQRTGDASALQMVEHTLKKMRMGGIYDHIGFGFHRYSTDSVWFIPHFEKMLYDQALLSMVYTEAYLATGKDEYKKTAEEIFTYVMRDMTSPEGGFFSAEDADSEGEEGKFYLWSSAEIKAVLGEEDGAFILKLYNATDEGNFRDEATKTRTATNLLYLKKPLPEIAADLGVSESELEKRIEALRTKLFKVREKRVHPYKDDKILTDWNGLMISALARGAEAFGEPKYLAASERAAKFILSRLRNKKDGRLIHRYRDGEAAINAKADDYAFMTMALLDLYEATFNVTYLKTAIELNDDFIAHFWDARQGGFFFTPTYAEELLVRPKEIYDGAVPSANSVAMLNLLRLERITGRKELGEMASKIGDAFSGIVSKRPASFTQLMVGLDFGVGPSYEVVVVGNPDSKDTAEMLSQLRSRFLPNKVVLFKPSNQENPEISEIAEFTKPQSALGNKATAYVCLNYNCKLPTTDINKMLELLQATR